MIHLRVLAATLAKQSRHRGGHGRHRPGRPGPVTARPVAGHGPCCYIGVAPYYALLGVFRVIRCIGMHPVTHFGAFFA